MVELNNTDLGAYQIGRNDLVMFKEELTKKRTEFEEQNKELIERISKLSEELEGEKVIFSDLAKEEFKTNGKKQLIGGLGIRVGTDLEYDDVLALNWAKKHELCLSLNNSEFEKVAKTQEIDCVTNSEKVTVTFPKEINYEKMVDEDAK